MSVERLKLSIAGEIALSNEPGATMKKWREIFSITQLELAKQLGISVSTISDYESGRRKSPGTKVLKRFVEALFAVDKLKGGATLNKLLDTDEPTDYFEPHEFAKPVDVLSFVEMIKGSFVSGEKVAEGRKIYGYTLINSIRTIMEIPPSKLPSLYGIIPERALIFTSVSTGRSPMVVVRVSMTKPSLVVLHGIKAEEVDKLAIKLAEKDNVPIAITNEDLSQIKQMLNKL